MEAKPVITVAKGADRIVSDRPLDELVARFGKGGVFVDGVAVADGGGLPAAASTEPAPTAGERAMLKDFERQARNDAATEARAHPKPDPKRK